MRGWGLEGGKREHALGSVVVISDCRLCLCFRLCHCNCHCLCLCLRTLLGSVSTMLDSSVKISFLPWIVAAPSSNLNVSSRAILRFILNESVRSHLVLDEPEPASPPLLPALSPPPPPPPPPAWDLRDADDEMERVEVTVDAEAPRLVAPSCRDEDAAAPGTSRPTL